MTQLVPMCLQQQGSAVTPAALGALWLQDLAAPAPSLQGNPSFPSPSQETFSALPSALERNIWLPASLYFTSPSSLRVSCLVGAVSLGEPGLAFGSPKHSRSLREQPQ